MIMIVRRLGQKSGFETEPQALLLSEVWWQRVCKLAFVLIMLMPFQLPAQRFVEINARIELLSYEINGSNQQSTNVDRVFTGRCRVGTNIWRIDNDFLKNGTQEWSFDGTNIYCSTRRTGAGTTNIPVRTGQPAFLPFSMTRSNITANIFPSKNGHPLGNIGVNIPWMAFCSGNYLKKAGEGFPLPTAMAGQDADASSYTVKSTSFDDNLGLPKEIGLYTSKTNGSLVFQYIVDQSTNMDGWTFPLMFHYTSYESDRNGQWKPYLGGIGKVITIIDSPKPVVALTPTAQTTVVDYRFRSPTRTIDAIIYNATNIISDISTNNPFLQAKYAERLKTMPRRPRFSAAQIRCALAVVICIPLAVIIKKSIISNVSR